MSDEMYSSDDLRAFQRVGEFLCWFSMLETNIDEAMIQLLGLEPVAGRLLLTYIPFARKCDFLEKLIRLETLSFTNEERDAAKKKLGKIHDKGRVRNQVAHSFFSAQQGAVKFLKAEKSLRPDTSATIDDATFHRHRNEMADLWGWIAHISHQIKLKMTEKQVADEMTDMLKNELADPLRPLH